MDFSVIVNEIKVLPEASLLKLLSIVSEVQLPKGHLLYKAETLNRNIYFISKGMARAYIDGEKGEMTFAFFNEGKSLLSLQSYVLDIPGYEYVELIEDCTLLRLHKQELEQLYEKDIHLANWGRRLADISFVDLEAQLISRQFKSTAERYADFINAFPDLLQRVKLKHIASYLGMTQVTLSRIRAKETRKNKETRKKKGD